MTPFDIEFVVPLCLKEEKYVRRAETFLKYGLINVGNKRTLLTLICFESELDAVESLVRSHYKSEVRFVTSTDHHPAVKYYQYLSKYSPDTARWMAKVDDDSITDVSTLVDKLDQHYDYERDYHIISAPARKESGGIEITLMRKYDLFSSDYTHTHEWEISVTSNQTMKRIAANKTASQLLADRAKISSGYCDQSLAIAAKMCKVYPTECSFITYHPYIGMFSYFGGHMTHIHFVSPDKNSHCLQYVKNKIDDKFERESDREIHDAMKDKEFFFTADKIQGSIIKLSEKGKIINETNPIVGKPLPLPTSMMMNDYLWTIRNGDLEFLGMEGKVTTVFKQANINMTMKGKTTFHPITEKILKIIDLKS